MKKITSYDALKLLEQGIYPKCEVERDLKLPVKSQQELENFIKKSSVQKCQFYGYEQEDIENFRVPNDSTSTSINVATNLLVSGEKIYARVIGEKNEFTFMNLNSFVAFLRKCDINGDSFLLYLRD